MKIGLNLTFLTGGGGGAARYARELVPALRTVAPDDALTVFVGRDAPEAVLEDPRSDGVEWVRLPVEVARRTHVPAQLALLPALVRRRRLDVLHSPANIGPLVTPGTARVVTLLDVIWLRQGELWDTGVAAKGFAVLSRACARNAHRVLTISESAREDLVEALGLSREKIDVSPLGVRLPSGGAGSAQDARREFDLGDARVILCVAQKRPYKNQAVLIRALAELPERDAILVLPGLSTPYEDELRSLASDLGVQARVRFPSWVSDEILSGLYEAATCFVLPSLMEGFGLPVLEAMARGCAVACSDRPALPEVAGDAALLFDPADQTSVTRAVARLVADDELRRTLVERGRARARRFTWERTAEATLAAYRRAVGDRNAGR